MFLKRKKRNLTVRDFLKYVQNDQEITIGWNIFIYYRGTVSDFRKKKTLHQLDINEFLDSTIFSIDSTDFYTIAIWLKDYPFC